MRCIDFHTHAFPDALADRAITYLEQEANCKAFHNGRAAALLDSMDRAGIDLAVVCSIATKPSQFEPIRQWSRQMASTRLAMLPSIHPDDPEAAAQVDQLAADGFKGIKLHPYYQRFVIDEDRMLPLYERMQHHRLILVCHTGFDIAFPRERRADPARVARVAELFPRLRFVATHLGGWADWEEVKKHLLEKPILIETSFALEYMPREQARTMLTAHPEDYLLFGTDSPWADQAAELQRMRALGLPPRRLEKILAANAQKVLGLPRLTADEDTLAPNQPRPAAGV